MTGSPQTSFNGHGVSKILFLEINTCIHQGCIKLINSDSKDIYNGTKVFYFQNHIYIFNFLFISESGKIVLWLPQKY